MSEVNNIPPKVQGSGGPNIEVVKGLLAIILGVIFIAFAHQVIVGVSLLLVGLILIYYGLRMLKITWVTKSIEEIIKKFHGLLRL